MSNESQPELKPCPFCGSDCATITKDHGTYEPGCTHCGTFIGQYSSERSAAAAWNRRAAREQSVPDGWQLVPIEPTLDMCLAGGNAPHDKDVALSIPEMYRAMLSAAPKAPQSDPYRELLADQAEAIDMARFAKCLVRFGIAAPEGGLEHLAAHFGEMVNAITLSAVSGSLLSAAPQPSIQSGPLRELGAFLARVLDEDQWATAESLLLRAGVSTPDHQTPSSEADRKDAERLDWIAHQDFSELFFALVQDAPHDGEYRVEWECGTAYGKTFREAIDAAMKKENGNADHR
jgi:hypothetical protein